MRSVSLNPVELSERLVSVIGYHVRLTTYKLGERYYCSADNVDPGAVIFRGEGIDRVEAESSAIEDAKKALLRYQHAPQTKERA